MPELNFTLLVTASEKWAPSLCSSFRINNIKAHGDKIMSNIINCLQSFNEKHNNPNTFAPSCSIAIQYLDEFCPQWRDEIQSPEAWNSVFEFDLKILHPDLSKFADYIFDLVNNFELEKLVWRNEKCCTRYRFAAIRRLRKFDEEQYLPEYIDWLKNGLRSDLCHWIESSSANWLDENVFDFHDSIAVAIQMVDKSRTSLSFYLAAKANENWEFYPETIKEMLIFEDNYLVRKYCTQSLWNKMTADQQYFILCKIVEDEYTSVHDIIAWAQYKDNENTPHLRFFESSFKMHYRENSSRGRRGFREVSLSDFTTPVITINGEYRPSRQMEKFLALLSEGGNPFQLKILQRVVSNIRHSSLERF